jgi:hypothetical protein
MQSAPSVEHEILAQRRQRAGRACLLQVAGCALEKLFVGQHAQAGRAVKRIAGGDVGGPEVFAQHALAGAGLLDLGDHSGLAGANLGPQRGLEAADVSPRFGLGTPAGQRAPRARRRDLLALDGDDALQDVRAHFRRPAQAAGR